MKIGILTFHRAYNYGAILQAYALQKKIDALGYECEIIDYLSRAKQNQIKLFRIDPKNGIKVNMVKLIKDIYRCGKKKQFEKFMAKEMRLSKNRYSDDDELALLDMANEYDVYIVGSDQVWNNGNNLGDSTFLLSFVRESGKRCSYAASFGSAQLDQKALAVYQQELKRFRVLTVREENAINKYSFLKDYGARVVIDPTLLLEDSDYAKIASPRLIKRKYAFLYTIGEARNLREFVADFCRDNGLVLVDSKKSLVFFRYSNPKDFLSFVIHADYVFTNSFHGTAFSIIFKKNFATEIHTKGGCNDRSGDLLDKLGLMNRDIDTNNFDIQQEINWDNVYCRLVEQKEYSTNILREIIGAER